MLLGWIPNGCIMKLLTIISLANVLPVFVNLVRTNTIIVSNSRKQVPYYNPNKKKEEEMASVNQQQRVN